MAPRGAGGSVLESRAPGFCLGTPRPELSRAASSSCKCLWKAPALQGVANFFGGEGCSPPALGLLSCDLTPQGYSGFPPGCVGCAGQRGGCAC